MQASNDRFPRWALLLAAMLLGAHFAGAVGAAPLVAVRDGKLTARISAVPLADLKRELEAVAPVDIRIATAEIGQHPVSANIAGEPVTQALNDVLRDFNFAQFTDPRSGREVYLVTSLADPNALKAARAPAPVAAVAPAGTGTGAAAAAGSAATQANAGKGGAATAARAATPRSLDEVRPVAPPKFDAYADQSIINSEMARVRQETLDRANSVLGNNSAYGPEVQRQALNEVVGLGDPRSLGVLQRLVSDPTLANDPKAAEVVAQAVWQYAAQQQFGNADANRLLQTMADSAQPQIRSIGEAAVRDSRNYLAKNPKP